MHTKYNESKSCIFATLVGKVLNSNLWICKGAFFAFYMLMLSKSILDDHKAKSVF